MFLLFSWFVCKMELINKQPKQNKIQEICESITLYLQ